MGLLILEHLENVRVPMDLSHHQVSPGEMNIPWMSNTVTGVTGTTYVLGVVL